MRKTLKILLIKTYIENYMRIIFYIRINYLTKKLESIKKK